MPTNTDIAKSLLIGDLGTPLGTGAAAEVSKQRTNPYFWDKSAADGMASTTTSETYTGIYLPYACKVTAYFVGTSGGLTADNTNYATVTVSTRDSAGANKTALGTLTTTITSSGNLTQGAGKAFVMASGAVSVAAGSTITFEIAKAGSGVVVPAGRVTFLIEDI